MPEFKTFDKIPRLQRECIITEKLDGTNGVVYVSDDGAIVLAGSRNQWLTEDKPDNYEFRTWVKANEDELRKLGPGYHYGEWWGTGIARRYGIHEKRWSLFNVARWGDDAVRPKCCHIVPTLAVGVFSSALVEECLARLERDGSIAAPGFKQPEGIVVYHKAANTLFKYTFGGDGHKEARRAA